MAIDVPVLTPPCHFSASRLRHAGSSATAADAHYLHMAEARRGQGTACVKEQRTPHTTDGRPLQFQCRPLGTLIAAPAHKR
jgi:hypothetical protein